MVKKIYNPFLESKLELRDYVVGHSFTSNFSFEISGTSNLFFSMYVIIMGGREEGIRNGLNTLKE